MLLSTGVTKFLYFEAYNERRAVDNKCICRTLLNGRMRHVSAFVEGRHEAFKTYKERLATYKTKKSVF